jgi:hypothetical protein
LAHVVFGTLNEHETIGFKHLWRIGWRSCTKYWIMFGVLSMKNANARVATMVVKGCDAR